MSTTEEIQSAAERLAKVYQYRDENPGATGAGLYINTDAFFDRDRDAVCRAYLADLAARENLEEKAKMFDWIIANAVPLEDPVRPYWDLAVGLNLSCPPKNPEEWIRAIRYVANLSK